MKILNELSIKNLKLNKKRSVMTIIGISLSIALVFTIINMVSALKTTMVKVVESEAGSQHVKVYGGDDYKKTLEANKDVRDLYEIRQLGYAKINSRNKYKPYLKLMSLTKDNFENAGIRLVDGKFPENANEILISENMIKDGKVKVSIGDKIILDVGNRIYSAQTSKEDKESVIWESMDQKYVSRNNLPPVLIEGESLSDQHKRSYKVVGIMKRPNHSIEVFSDPGFSAFTLASKGEKYFDSFLYYKLNNVDNIQKHVGAVYKGDINRYEINSSLMTITGKGSDLGLMRMLYTLVGVLILIILITSIMIIRNSFSISIVERTKEFGILKSIGATDRQVVNNIIFEGLSLGLIGAVFGLIIGVVASFILIQVVNILLKGILEGMKFDFYISGLSIFISLFAGFISIFTSSYLIAKRSRKFSPIEAIRSSNDVKVNKKDVKTPRYIGRLFNIGGLIAYKNVRRNRKKYRATVASLALSVMVFIGMFSMVDSVYTSSRARYAYINHQVRVYSNFNDNKDKHANKSRYEKFSKLVSNNFTEEKYAIYKNYDAEIDLDYFTDEYKKYNHNGFAVKDGKPLVNVHEINNASYDLLMKENRLKKETKAVVINRAKHKDEDKKTFVYNILKELNIEISSVDFENSTKDKIKLEVEQIDRLLPGMEEYSNSTLDIYVRENTLNDTFVCRGITACFDSKNPSETVKKLDEVLDNDLIGEYSVFNIQEQINMINNLLLLIQIFGYGFITVITLIALTNVFNTITSNVFSRKKEYGTLISCGMSDGQIKKMSLFESLFIGFKSLVWGLPLGLGISVLMYKIIATDIVTEYRFPIKAILISISTVLLITFVIMSYSISKIRSQNVIETIKNENI